MFKKLLFALLATTLFITGNGFAQSGDFCGAVSVILKDAPNQFKNVRGNVSETSYNVAIHKTAIIVPGTINSRFVYSMGKFYEGALAQSKNLADIKPPYEKYKKMLNDCLSAKGLKMNAFENFTPGLAEYKKVTFMYPFSKDDNIKSLKGHVAMEVDYNKDSKLYTLIMFIYEH